MAHEIMGSLFYADRQAPAWHNIDVLRARGITDDNRPRKATEVLELFGNPSVGLEPLAWVDASGQAVQSGFSAIVRQPLAGETAPVQLGVVANSYRLITPDMAAGMCDRQIPQQVETMAMLRQGKIMFVTFELPPMDIKGDEVKNYLVLYNPMDGATAASGFVTQVRVVCMNTLQAALHSTVQQFTITHTAGADVRLEKWIGRTYKNALEVSSVIQEAYTALASKPASVPQVKMIAENLYPFPTEPNREIADMRKMSWEQIMRHHESVVDWTDTAHKTIVRLFEGQGTGMETVAAAGTAWGAFNAAAEFITYRRGTRESIAVNSVSGDRATELRKAYRLSMAL